MANDEPEFVPYVPERGVFVRFEDGLTTVQMRGFAVSMIAPITQYWVGVAARYTAAPLDELAGVWVTAAREIVAMAPPSFEFPRDAESQERLARRGEPLQREMILSHALAREILELSREKFEQPEAPQQPPVLPSPFGAWHYGERMAPEDALRWLRLAGRLMEARGDFTAEHHVMGAELAGLAGQEFKQFNTMEAAPLLEAGRVFLEGRRKEQEAKEPARMATEARNTEICQTARERRDGGKSRVSTVEFLMKEHNLGERSINQILKAGEVYWGKTP